MAELAAIQAQLQQILEENRVLREQQQRQQEQTALLTRLAESMTELARNTKREEPRKLLVDTKGIGKPERFNSEEQFSHKPCCQHLWEGVRQSVGLVPRPGWV